MLPPDIPHRNRLIAKSAQHLELIAAANEYMNLTRISSPQEAAVKHVFDSVAPWKHFYGAKHVLDAGTGAGFPGIPLALALPEICFTLADSTGKKARFVDSAVESLELKNVQVSSERAEVLGLAQQPDIITARAVAPLHRLLDLFGKALKQGSRLLLYKGPEAEAEFGGIQNRRVIANIVSRYELPDGLGSRTLVSISAQER